MSQQPQHSLLESIQSEVSKEASPFLTFLLVHSRKLILLIVLIILAIIGTGIWQYQASGKLQSATELLGKISLMPDSADKLAALEKFVSEADSGLRMAATLELAKTADLQQDYAKSAQAWGYVAQNDKGAMQVPAAVAEARALSRQGKIEDAMSKLNGLLKAAPQEMRPLINGIIADTAEMNGDYARALAACEDTLKSQDVPDRAVWEQRAAYLKQQESLPKAKSDEK